MDDKRHNEKIGNDNFTQGRSLVYNTRVNYKKIFCSKPQIFNKKKEQKIYFLGKYNVAVDQSIKLETLFETLSLFTGSKMPANMKQTSSAVQKMPLEPGKE